MLAFAGSTRMMLAGCGLLAAGMLAGYADATAPAWQVAAPLALLALNLAAAIVRHPRLRRGGLGVFHLALLALLVVAAMGRLARLEGRVELTEGQALAPEDVEVLVRGPWHDYRLPDVRFVQGPYSVDYAPGIRRAQTRSEVALARDEGGHAWRIVGDDTPLLAHGYRFYTTHNKGYAPLVTLAVDGQAPVTGSLHMPSYPLFDWKQENRLSVAGGPELRVFLNVERPPDEISAWTLDPRTVPTTLTVYAQDERIEIGPGQAARLGNTTLRYERMLGWMGYRIYADPALPWLFALACLAIGGLGWHLLCAKPEAARTRAPGKVGGRKALA
jgi:cytochrome c biogenesis protein